MKKLKIIIFMLLPFLFFSVFQSENSKAYYYDCSQYGTFAYSDGFGYCKCMSGYVMDENFMGAPYCVSGSTYCFSKYGYGSTYDYLSKSCKCSYGYVWGTNILGKDECISESQYCHNKYGYNSTFNSLTDKCECGYGYELSIKAYGGGLECKSCFSKYGLHSSYNSLINKCECDNDYTLNNNNKCVEKQNNVYFILKEVDPDKKKAIIKSEYSYQYYLITYGYGCYNFSIGRYINNKIVVNLGTDFNLDMFDQIVLQDDNETCDILSVKNVDFSYTLNSENNNLDTSGNISAGSILICPDLINGYLGEDNKCYCNIGYKWSFAQASCVKNTIIPEGAIIKTANNPDIYIVKYVGAKKFKRLILSPSVFNNYGHLKWENVMDVSQAVLDEFTTSELVRAVNDDKIYRLYPQGDTGQKRLIKNNSVLTRLGFDQDSIYEINSFDRESYVAGNDLE